MKKLLVIGLIVYIVLIIMASVLPQVAQNEDFKNNDHIFHFFGYFLLVIILFFTLKEFKVRYIRTITFSTCIVFSFILEFIQKFIAGRTYNPMDLVANFIGITLGAVIVLLFRKV